MKFYEETFDAIARIEEPADQALQHFNTVRSLYRQERKTNQENGARFLFTETLKLIRKLKDAKQKLYLYGLGGIFLAEQEHFADAFAVANEMDQLLLDSELFSSNAWKEEIEDKKNLIFACIAKNQARRKLIADAIATADSVVDFDEYEETILSIASQLEPNDFESQTHSKLLEELESPDRIAAAQLAFAEICQKDEKLFKWKPLISELIQEVDEKIIDSTKKDEIYRKAISVLLAEEEKSSEIENILQRIDSPAVRAFSQLEIAKRQIGQNTSSILQQVLMEVRKIESNEEKQDIFEEIGKMYAFFEQQKESRNAFREAIQCVDSQKNDFQKIRSLSKIARSLSECGERSAALNLYKRAIKIVESVEDLYFRCNWFREVSRCLLEDHFTEEALNLIDRFANQDHEENEINLNRRELKRQSLDFRSFKTMLLHQESLARSQAAKILHSEQNQESQNLAEEQINQATVLARKIIDPIWRAETLREIAEYYSVPNLAGTPLVI